MISYSIIMPAYNAEKTIVESIKSALKQMGEEDELIIVDDGSTDKTVNMLEPYLNTKTILLKHPKNLGIAASRNTALKKATSQYIAFLDADDIWPSNRQHKITEHIQKNNCDVISGLITHFYCSSLKNPKQYKLPEPQKGLLPSSTVIKKSCIDEAGQFDENIKTGEFIEFVSRLKNKKFRFNYLAQPVLHRRIHQNNYTTLQANQKSDYLFVIRKHLQRRSFDESKS